MGYYVRAFCTSPDVPTLQNLFAWVCGNGYEISLDKEYDSVDLDSSNWTDTAIHYKEGRSPILTDISRDDGSQDALLPEELAEFREFLEDVEDGPAKEKVLGHLAATRYIVANQHLGDIDDDGYEVSGLILNYFVRSHGGMVQADLEGFYDGDDLIVALE